MATKTWIYNDVASGVQVSGHTCPISESLALLAGCPLLFRRHFLGKDTESLVRLVHRKLKITFHSYLSEIILLPPFLES